MIKTFGRRKFSLAQPPAGRFPRSETWGREFDRREYISLNWPQNASQNLWAQRPIALSRRTACAGDADHKDRATTPCVRAASVASVLSCAREAHEICTAEHPVPQRRETVCANCTKARIVDCHNISTRPVLARARCMAIRWIELS